MNNRYQKLLSSGLKSHIYQYDELQIMDLFNNIQNSIENIKEPILFFLTEGFYSRIYRENHDSYIREKLTPDQFNIFIQLRRIDNQCTNVNQEERMEMRRHRTFGPEGLHFPNFLLGGGGGKTKKTKQENAQQMRKILSRYPWEKLWKELKIRNFYQYLARTVDMFINLQSILDPQKFTELKDVLVIKEIIAKANGILDTFHSIFSINSLEVNYSLLYQLQDLMMEKLVQFIHEKESSFHSDY